MSAMRSSSLALILGALAITPSTTLAQSVEVMTVRNMALDDSPEGLAVQVEAGILLFDQTDEVTFLCASSWQEEGAQADWLVQTGARQPLIAGPSGPFLALESGCEWARLSGPVDSANVVGVHSPEAGGQTVLFAVTSAFGPDRLLRTDDGGFTSSSSGDFAQLDRDLRGLAGHGDHLVVIGDAATTGDLVAWRSEDGGETLVPLALAASPGDDLVGVGESVVWLTGDSALTAYDLSSAAEILELTLESPLVASAVQSSGAIWYATDDGRLHRRDPQSDAGETFEIPATSILVRDERVWVGLRAGAAGDVLVQRLDPGETLWVDAALRPGTFGYPEGCETLQIQTCASDSARILPPVSEEPGPGPTGPVDSNGGCSGGGGGTPLPLESCVFLLVSCLATRVGAARRNRSPGASP